MSKIKHIEEDIKELYNHARVANEEMACVKEDMSAVKTDIMWIKSIIDSINSRTWWILGTIVIGFAVMIFERLE